MVVAHLKSNAVAYLALFVALGGVSWAAVKLPKNSVGARQVRSNAIRSAEVKNRSLFARDFKAGQLPTGARGPAGQAGPRGAAGTKGGTGATGPSDIHVVGTGSVSLTNADPTEVASLTVPAGSYLLGASVGATKPGGAGNTTLGCSLADSTAAVGATVWDGKNTNVLTDASPLANISLAGADNFDSPTTIKVVCVQATQVHVDNTRLWAIKTGNLDATLPLPIAG